MSLYTDLMQRLHARGKIKDLNTADEFVCKLVDEKFNAIRKEMHDLVKSTLRDKTDAA